MEITVSNGILTAPLNIIIPESNIHGTLIDASGQAIQKASLQLYRITSNSSYGTSVSVTDGIFDLYLADGQYGFEGYWDETTQEYKALTGRFTVSGGQVTEGSVNIFCRRK